MELYCSGRPEACLGCGGSITAGDVVVPTERGWLLCLDCGTGLLIGQSLPAWPGAEPELRLDEGAEGAWTEVVSSLQRQEAMEAHPGSKSRSRNGSPSPRGSRSAQSSGEEPDGGSILRPRVSGDAVVAGIAEITGIAGVGEPELVGPGALASPVAQGRPVRPIFWRA